MTRVGRPSPGWVAAVATLADEIRQDLAQLRVVLDGVGAPSRPASALTDDWAISEQGLLGPDGVLGFLVSRARQPDHPMDARQRAQSARPDAA